MSTPLVGAPQLSPVTLELHERSTHLPRISRGTPRLVRRPPL